MIYKNGVKEYTLTTVLFGIPMGIIFGIMKWDVLYGLVSGVLCGLLFTLLMYLFVKSQEKKYDKMRLKIAQERKIICDGAATIRGNGGWLFFTERGLEFYPHKFNVSRDSMMIPINEIKSVITYKNQIIVDTINDSKFGIVLSHNKEWVKQIQNYIKN